MRRNAQTNAPFCTQLMQRKTIIKSMEPFAKLPFTSLTPESNRERTRIGPRTLFYFPKGPFVIWILQVLQPKVLYCDSLTDAITIFKSVCYRFTADGLQPMAQHAIQLWLELHPDSTIS
jgi:hypothetical protein